jgi:hypothetical protein
MAAGAITKETKLLFLDAIFHLAPPAIYRWCGASCIGLPFFDKGCVVAESLGRWFPFIA